MCGLTVVYYWTCQIIVGAVGSALYQWAYSGRIDWWKVVGSAMLGAYLSLPLPTAVKNQMWVAAQPKLWWVIQALRTTFGL